MSRTLLGLVLLSILAGPFGQRRVVDTLPPVDEGMRDSSFVAFRSALIKAARARDLATVKSMIVAQPKAYDTLSDDEPGSMRFFRRFWGLNTDATRFFTRLEDVLQHGGRFVGADHFLAPYWYATFPGNDMDYHSYVIAVREQVPIFAEENEKTKPIAVVSYAVLPAGGGLSWFPVTLKDGRRGYVRALDVRQPSGARAHFRKVKGVWKLTIFTEGMD